MNIVKNKFFIGVVGCFFWLFFVASVFFFGIYFWGDKEVTLFQAKLLILFCFVTGTLVFIIFQRFFEYFCSDKK